MLIAKNLKHLRTLNNLKQKDIQEIGISRSRFAQYENGLVTPPVPIVEKLANYFNVSVNDLLYTDLEQTQYAPLIVKQRGGKGTVEMEMELLKQEIRHLKETLKWKDEKISMLEEQLQHYGGKKGVARDG